VKTRGPKRPQPPLPGQLDLFSADVAPRISPPMPAPQLQRAAQVTAPKPAPVSVKAESAQPQPLSAKNIPTQAKFAAAPKIASPPSAPRPKRPPRKIGSLLDPVAAAEHCGLSVSMMAKMRCTGKGPRFLKITGAAVRYDPKDLDVWLESRRRRSTSES
jgi:predicted DNA-binding transcriptional regulator AlpA